MNGRSSKYKHWAPFPCPVHHVTDCVGWGAGRKLTIICTITGKAITGDALSKPKAEPPPPEAGGGTEGGITEGITGGVTRANVSTLVKVWAGLIGLWLIPFACTYLVFSP